MVTDEQLALKQEEMQVRSTIRRSKQQSRNRMGKIKPRTEQEQLASTRASIQTLIKRKMAQPNTDARSFCWLLHSFLKLGKKEEIQTFKEFFSYLPPPGENDNDTVIQIREPQSDPTGSGRSSVEPTLSITDPSERL